MKIFKHLKLISLLLLISFTMMMVTPTESIAAQSTVNLGTTSSFAVLAGTTITNTGATTINGDAGGDIGVSSGTAVTGFPPGEKSGIVYVGDGEAAAAQVDLTIAYNDAAGRTPVTTIPTELGGTTLEPGVYKSESGTFQITGTLTLDAENDPDGVFIFKTASTLVTAANSNIVLINGARYCRIFWQVGSSATLGVRSHFIGHIFALESITATTGATVQGQLLARNGAVTLDTNTITNGICEDVVVSPADATLKVIKQVINDNGRTSVAGDFNIHVKTAGDVEVAASPAVGLEAGRTYTLPAGDYVISEDSYPGYVATYTGDSDALGKITLAAGDSKTVTIINNDTPIPPVPPTPSTPSTPPSSGDSWVTVHPPLINVVKIPNPLSLPSGSGLVTYTYKVTNPGKVSLRNVRLTDDKVTPVTYVSGDVNKDNLLQTNETWIYTSEANLTKTTTNAVIAKGSANGMTATDVAYATVVVTPVVPPLINVTKVPEPLALIDGQGPVTYTYKVTNPGTVALSNITIADDKVTLVTYVSGDVNEDNLLQANETWIYTSETNLAETTTNTVVVSGSANDMTATDVAYATVVVTPKVVPIEPTKPVTPVESTEITETVTGGKLPKTSTNSYRLLLIGGSLILISSILWVNRKRYE